MNKTDIYAEEPKSPIPTSELLAPRSESPGVSSDPQTADYEKKESENVGSSREGSPDISVGENDYVPGTFEGPEKTMEVVFHTTIGAPDGLRALTRPQVDRLCTLAKCTILSKMSNSYMDAYVLSESSLFIYKHRLIMKTCGTTTLLRCLNALLEYADALGMELEWVGYSRKNLMFPSAQHWPHSSFGDEIQYISSHTKLQDRLKGAGYILGPITGDHWFVYVADHSHTVPPCLSLVPPVPPTQSMERTLNMMMFDMAPEVGQLFYQKNVPTGREMTHKSGIFNLVPGAQIDETAFTPCGYSMNAILHDAYSTIHITPEPECSYASFETNTCLPNYNSMVRNVLGVFRPKRFVLTMFGDEAAIDSIAELPVDPRHYLLPSVGSYVRTSVASTCVEADLRCIMACYTLETSPLPRASSKAMLPRVASGTDLAMAEGLLMPSPRLRERGYSCLA